ncbi:ABC transporter ATP-binding protein [Poseidonibacter lekithochrous]|uniref:ABC transporter ATP-binding protein n=1 Tax=Poseidonibacter lekithochrous TaxID=1904463 RepID=UPI0008FC6545|nr:ABC transporter ATP-binding protein [Poseidonibacter lekithochrous]QKJ23419.1 nickel ABC transporter, ATP-binding protein [Poseidonibacter lekithochrous]
MLLEVKKLKTQFFSDKGVNTAVNGIDFHIEKGKTLCIVGESGSGKSMTSLSIMGLVEEPGRVTEGEIIFEGEDLLKLNESTMRNIRGKDIAMIFQEPMTSLNPSYTVGYQIDEVLRLHQKELNKTQRKQRVIELFEEVGIPLAADKYNEYPFKLSGGQRQRVMIAMAMACEPKLLIADEPTTALDVTIQAQVLELMNELKAKKGTSILFITHDLGVVAQMADEVVVMYKGNVVEQASVKELFDNPRHPYTKALLNSIPRPGKVKRKSRLDTVDENVNYLDFPKEIR